jgi:glutathione synthase/RimK-type ligase-like ATP-grasp enzyme
MFKFIRKLIKKDRKILIVVGGKKDKIEVFGAVAKKLGLDVALATFSEINFDSQFPYRLKVDRRDLAGFDLIYIRMVGKRLEDATLLVNFANQNRIKIVDRLYQKALFIPSSIIKSQETARMIEKGIPIPATIYGNLSYLKINVPKFLAFPFVVKNTIGRKAREVWLVENKTQMTKLTRSLLPKEKEGSRFFAQEFIRASKRIRVLVIGGKAVGAVVRGTKWRRIILGKKKGEELTEIKESLTPVPVKYSNLATSAAKAANLDIAGIDILEADGSGELYVIEANAAPAWKLISKYCSVNVEEEILKYLNEL